MQPQPRTTPRPRLPCPPPPALPLGCSGEPRYLGIAVATHQSSRIYPVYTFTVTNACSNASVVLLGEEKGEVLFLARLKCLDVSVFASQN
ncbi:unnamed protein product [Bubo scandiacus]